MGLKSKSAYRSTAVVAAAAMAATMAIAAPAGAAPSDMVQASTEPRPGFDQAVEILEPYVFRSPADGTFVLEAPLEEVGSIDPKVYEDIQEGMALINGMIVAGLLTSTDDLRAVPAGTGSDRSVDASEPGILHHGKNEITCSWVNCTLRLDDYWTGQLIGAINVGAGAAGVAAVLAAAGIITSPGAIPSGLAAAILALGGAVIGLCSNSHGVWIRWGLGHWCGGQ